MPDGNEETLPQRRKLDTSLWRERLRVLFALVLREMSMLYGRNPGGYIWAIIEPLGMIIILSIAFSLVLRSPSLGTSFLLFYATGMLPFLMFQTISRVIGNALGFSKALLQYPSVLWIDAIFARACLHVLTELLVTTVVLGGIMIFVESSQQIHLQHMLVAMVGMVLLGLGMGLINAILFSLWPIWRSIWGIVTRPLLLASGVLYICEDMPRAAQDVL
ncbi:ABC transporter permease [uncultured Lentibacter sp.]|uniref:ABC transporter permease n=1 Tax=uncultured Lentibacter sp. TaxID=1659309 RepID=UPI0026093D89|nr:ABC transporter permease [uncultured Lentibacter sp.]